MLITSNDGDQSHMENASFVEIEDSQLAIGLVVSNQTLVLLSTLGSPWDLKILSWVTLVKF